VSAAVFLVPGRLDARTGGSIYNQRMVAALRARGWTIDVHELDGSFPAPSSDALERASRVLASLQDGALVVVDGLVFGAMPDVVVREQARLRFVALVHMPLAWESGLDASTTAARERDERRALPAAAFVVVTGPSTLGAVAAYGVGRDRLAIVTPGTDRAPISPGSGGNEQHLLCVAALTPGKGHETLFRALAAHRDRAWRLTCAGSPTRTPGTVERLRASLRVSGLADRVTFAGELDGDALEAAYAVADVFVLATARETFGMAVAEALAHGIPVVSTATGAIPALVGSDAGVLAVPGDAAAFAQALSRVLTDAVFRIDLRSGALRARDRLRSWDEAAATMAGVLERVTW
jgi:glycosyltransferase involved in cell wall biosynthesis